MTLVRNLVRYREYILRNALHGFRVRYAGTGLGVLWGLLAPALQVLVYTTIFTELVGPRRGGAGGRTEFVLYLCSGLFPWLAFARTVSRGSSALVDHSRQLKKLPIPEEVFVAVLAVEETLNLMLYLVLLVVAGLFVGHVAGWTLLLLPVAGLASQALAFGLGLALSPVRVFFRDVGHVLDVVLQVWMWTLPVCYMESVLPERLRAFVEWNPPRFHLVAFRDLFLNHQLPSAHVWAAMLVWSAGAVLLGALVLGRLRGDVRDAL